MIIITDLLKVDHLISVFVTFTVFTLSIQTPHLLTILYLKFEQVQFTTTVVSKNIWMSGKQCRP